MIISKKIWESTRPAECKESGIGKAIDKWLVDCKPVDTLQEVSALVTAGDAEKAFTKAIAAAKQKLATVKATDKKKAPTEALLKLWSTTVSVYSTSLDAEIQRRRTEGVAALDTEAQEYQGKLTAMTDSCEAVINRLGSASITLGKSLLGAREDAQKVDGALQAALDAQASGNTEAGNAAVKSAESLASKVAARLKEAESEAQGAMDFDKTNWPTDWGLVKPADKGTTGKLSDRHATVAIQIPTMVDSLKELSKEASQRSLETYQVMKGTADKMKIYQGQCSRLVGQLYTWAQDRDVVARECSASLSNCEGDVTKYEAAADPGAKEAAKQAAKENFQMGSLRLKRFITVVHQHTEAYKTTFFAMPSDVVNESSPVFKPLFAEINSGVKLLNEDREKARKAGDKVKALTQRVIAMA